MTTFKPDPLQPKLRMKWGGATHVVYNDNSSLTWDGEGGCLLKEAATRYSVLESIDSSKKIVDFKRSEEEVAPSQGGVDRVD